MTRRDPSAKTQGPTGEGSREDLLTSEDIFGDLVDEPTAAGQPKEEHAPPARSSPIKVRIGDPTSGQGATAPGLGPARQLRRGRTFVPQALARKRIE